MRRLQDKRCLIVGGTSGLGLAAARRFLEEGAALVIAGRSADKAAACLAELRSDTAHFVGSDASDPVDVDALFAAANKQLGGLDVVYHVAGISGRKHGDGPLHECTDEGWQATIDANLKSVFLTNRAAVRHFLGHGGGAILNMSSVLAFSPSPRS